MVLFKGLCTVRIGSPCAGGGKRGGPSDQNFCIFTECEPPESSIIIIIFGIYFVIFSYVCLGQCSVAVKRHPDQGSD